MKVFLSWSGNVSKRVAEVLRDWLPNVIQAIEPWLSSEDIHKGASWSANIAKELVNSTAGIICVTHDNQESPWLNFEAGALSRTVVEPTMVCTYLLGIKATDVTGPLAQFQATLPTKSDTRKLIVTLNHGLADRRLSDKKLDEAFDMWWPDLETKLDDIDVGPSKAIGRSTEAMTEEILSIVRELIKQPPTYSPSSPYGVIEPTVYNPLAPSGGNPLIPPGGINRFVNSLYGAYLRGGPTFVALDDPSVNLFVDHVTTQGKGPEKVVQESLETPNVKEEENEP